ncbi:MAG: hypothetical protein M3297_14655 [Thermoproteota archaeon]|nr:hypothetical protein [Thermoproteota archaeon]
MAVFGVSVSIAIIAAGGGFSGSGPSVFDPPDASDLFNVGNNIHDGTIMNYSLNRIGGYASAWNGLGGNGSLIDSSVSIRFTQDDNDENNWQASISIINGTEHPSTKNLQGAILLSKEQLTNVGPVSQVFKPYYELIESSIFEIRDIAEGSQYLVVGSQWNSISGEVTTVPVKISAQEEIRINSQTFETYVLSYTVDSKTSKIWIAKNIPLPVKAEVYNAIDQLQYEYELESFKR